MKTYLVKSLSVALLAILVVGYSCKKRVDYLVKSEFRYYNRTNELVHVFIKHGITTAFGSYELMPGDSLVLTNDDIGPESVEARSYVPAITADTTIMQFGDTLCYAEYNKSGAILHNIDRYTYTRRGSADYIFYFDIDSLVFERASKCL